MRSRVASDFASTAAGRNASHSTSVPRRGARHVTGERGQGDDRIEDATTIGRPAVLGDVEEEVVRHPERVEPGALGGLRVRRRRSPPQRRLPGDREVVLRECESDAHRRHSTGVAPGPRRTLQRCWSACRTCRRGATAPCSTRWPTRAAPRCSTCTSTPTTTAPCSPWPATACSTRVRALARRSRGAGRPARPHRRAPAVRRARRRAVRRARRRTARATPSIAARAFAAWIVDAARAPGVPLRRTPTRSGRTLPGRAPRGVHVTRPRLGPGAPAPRARRSGGRRATAAGRGQLRPHVRRRDAGAHASLARCASATGASPAYGRSVSRFLGPGAPRCR